jgi:hypothetical protein
MSIHKAFAIALSAIGWVTVAIAQAPAPPERLAAIRVLADEADFTAFLRGKDSLEAESYVTRGLLLLKEGKIAEAASALERAVSMDPLNRAAMLGWRSTHTVLAQGGPDLQIAPDPETTASTRRSP